MISFVVPAHNEQACLGRTLQAIHESARAAGHAYEIIVVDDASTDATAAIAQQNGARVVSVNRRQIAATRNAGARAATGGRLFFVDADTIINPRAVTAALRAMDRGAVGGGAPAWVAKGEVVPLYIWLFYPFVVIYPKLCGFSGGAFMFCTRAAFQATGGFDERLFWSEEVSFALALRREGRFVGLWQRVTTSGRRVRKLSGLQLLAGGIKMIFSPRTFNTERAMVEKVWYDSNRADDDIMPNSRTVQLSNGIAAGLALILVTGLLWNFVPDACPLTSLPGKLRLAIEIFLCHVGLILWPLAIVLLVNLLRQKRCTGLLQSAAMIALFSWQAWVSTHGVIWTWTHCFHWLAHFLMLR